MPTSVVPMGIGVAIVADMTGGSVVVMMIEGHRMGAVLFARNVVK
ncbi:MAG: hypothetical protein ACRC2A_04150 [Enterobacterales bacterium]